MSDPHDVMADRMLAFRTADGGERTLRAWIARPTPGTEDTDRWACAYGVDGFEASEEDAAHGPDAFAALLAGIAELEDLVARAAVRHQGRAEFHGWKDKVLVASWSAAAQATHAVDALTQGLRRVADVLATPAEDPAARRDAVERALAAVLEVPVPSGRGATTTTGAE